MRRADPSGLASAVPNVHAGPPQHHVEVHAVDSDTGVVLDAQVDVLLDAEPKVAVFAEVVAPELVLTDLKEIMTYQHQFITYLAQRSN